MGVVYLTQEFREQIIADGDDPDELVALFGDWKSDERNEFEYIEFGKDGFYEDPKVGGEMVLKHVHLPPHPDSEAMKDWEKRHRRRSRKKSNRCLIYASRRNGDHLLIDVLDDPPGAHVAMKNKTMMHRLASIAAEFIQDGIIAA